MAGLSPHSQFFPFPLTLISGKCSEVGLCLTVFSGLSVTLIPFALELSLLLMQVGYLPKTDCKTGLLFWRAGVGDIEVGRGYQFL